jgi:nitrous oxidase accessory protein NosD
MTRTAIAICALFLLLSGPLSGATLRVPSQYAMIQAAIDASNSGDTVLVASGTYNDVIVTFENKSNLVVTSEFGREATTLVIVTAGIAFSLCDECKLDGFTISGWHGVYFYPNSNATLSNCRIENAGNGINAYASPGNEIRILDNIITGNAEYGIEAQATQYQISGNTNYLISGNEIYGNPKGGITFAGNASEATCQIMNNKIYDNGSFGLSLLGCYGQVTSNLIAENAENGISLKNSPDLLIKNNTIARNLLSGICFLPGNPSSPRIENNVIALNGYAGIFTDQACNAWISCNDVWGNSNLGNGNYIGFIPDQTGFNGNISTDPYFCNASGGVYSLAANSPALHASCGPMGAILIPGCSNQTAVEHLSWGSIKALYK